MLVAVPHRAAAPGRITPIGESGSSFMGRRYWKAGVMLSALLAGAGCTTLRELPRSEYAARPQRDRVRVATTEGLVYEFDYVKVENDTLTGYREHDVEGPVSEESSLPLPLDQVQTMSVRGIDWYRTGLVGGGALAVLVAAGLTAVNRNSHDDGSPSGGVKPPPE